jgi:hypothetical protein
MRNAQIRETDRANVRVVYSTMVLIVADFFLLSLEAICLAEKKATGPLAVTFGYVKSCTLHACQTIRLTDRPEIGQSIATVLIASSEVCACAAS